ncbi:MAG: sugar ABC transporter ATP-binding protein [Betaproteobacteria bacterium]
MTSALRLDGIARRFGATVALDGASLALEKGEVRALVGENGAGKSTLLSIVGGLLQPDGGSMQVEQGAYAPRSPKDARAAGIALIHQELSLFPHLSVAENVLVGREPRRRGVVDRDAARRQTREVLAEFGHPEIDPDARVGRLPIGARQVVEICRAIAARARVVLMDEPTSSLPRGDVERLFALVRRLAERGVAVLYISHFLEESRAVASTFTVLRDGRTVADGRLASVPNDTLIATMVGRTVSELFPGRRDAAAGTVALDVRGLASPPGLHEASFSLRTGEVLGVFGLMGSGRTEMVRALYGLDRPAAGELSVAGRACRLAEPPDARLRRGLGYLSEDRKGEGLALPLSVADNVTLTRLEACTRLGVLQPARQEEQARRRAEELSVRMAGLRQPVSALSGGNQQKVAFARLVHQDADVLLLDEPTRGVDVGSRAQIYGAIAGAAGRGKAVLMVSSYLPELLGVCDRLAVMSRGRLSPARPVADWTPEAALEAAIGA